MTERPRPNESLVPIVDIQEKLAERLERAGGDAFRALSKAVR